MHPYNIRRKTEMARRQAMGVKEASETLGIGQKTLMKHIKDGALPATRFGERGRYIISKETIDKILRRDK